jgi:sugar/nucleoside kinase (ribokinase family)
MLEITASEPCVLSVGEPIIDMIYQVDKQFVESELTEFGGSRKVDKLEFQRIKTLLSDAPFQAIPGGCSASTLKGISKLGLHCRYFGKIGHDDSGKLFGDSLINNAVIPQLLTSDNHTSELISLVTPDGQRSMISYFGAGEELKEEELTEELFEGVNHLVLVGYSLYNDRPFFRSIELAKKAGVTISLDLASFQLVRLFKPELLLTIYNSVDVLFANEDEARELTGLPPMEACYRLQKFCPVVVVSVGKNGCYVGSQNEMIHCPGRNAKVVDTTGAGDLFASGFLWSYLKGYPLKTCGKMGNLLGSHCVEVVGAEIPDWKWAEIYQETEKLLTKSP